MLEETIPEVAVEAGKIMNWLRNVARALAKANRGIAWTTPAGFRVVHETREPKTVRVTTLDRTFIVYEEDKTRKITRGGKWTASSLTSCILWTPRT